MSSLDLWQELRGTESAGRLTGREHRLKDPGRIDARVAEDVRVKGRTAGEALAAITDRIRSPAGVLRRVMHPDGQRQISGIEAGRIVGRVRAASAAAAS